MLKDTWEKHLEKNIAEIIEQVQTIEQVYRLKLAKNIG